MQKKMFVATNDDEVRECAAMRQACLCASWLRRKPTAAPRPYMRYYRFHAAVTVHKPALRMIQSTRNRQIEGEIAAKRENSERFREVWLKA